MLNTDIHRTSSRARHARAASCSTAEKVPEGAIDVVSPPAVEQEGDASRRNVDASRQDGGLGYPPRGGVSPTRTREEFLTPHDDASFFDHNSLGEGGSSQRPDGHEEMSHRSEMGGSVPKPNAEDGPEEPKVESRSCNPHAVETRWHGDVPLMEDQDACVGSVWVSKVHPGRGIPREGLAFRGDFDEASQYHVKSSGKFAALIQKFETPLRAAKEEVLRLRREDEKAEDINAVVADLKLEKLAFEEKVGVLNKEIMKTLSLQDIADQLRAQHADLTEKVRRGVEAAVAKAECLRRSRQEWAEVAATQVYDSVSDLYAPRLCRLSEFFAQRDAVEAAVVRRQVDEALLDFVKKIWRVDLDFNAVEERLGAKLAKSVVDGDAIDEVVITDDDFAKPSSVSILVLPGSPSRRNNDGAGSGAGPSALGAKSV
ncbi:unnamed protein product [Microthlaspi erraticum]|uniref:Uncharacterized protein n=1 Tax=Microthlaspi erraticum TaxID=1685480 RepID=A0A6D2KKJ8_9BRAS|nr:unnamed protein product [Microthlaspi erraticum]CAA7049721.1 unnamed protein product [Microthlaspi erraticum]